MRVGLPWGGMYLEAYVYGEFVVRGTQNLEAYIYETILSLCWKMNIAIARDSHEDASTLHELVSNCKPKTRPGQVGWLKLPLSIIDLDPPGFQINSFSLKWRTSIVKEGSYLKWKKGDVFETSHLSMASGGLRDITESWLAFKYLYKQHHIQTLREYPWRCSYYVNKIWEGEGWVTWTPRPKSVHHWGIANGSN